MKGDKDALKKAQVVIGVLRKGAEQRQQQQKQQTKQQTKQQKKQQTQVTEAFEESKGAAELMCTHCRELFSPHSWELHMELGCPQDPAEQFMSEEVVSNSTSRGRHALLS